MKVCKYMLISLEYYSYVRFGLRFPQFQSFSFKLCLILPLPGRIPALQLKKKKILIAIPIYTSIYFYFCTQKDCYDIYVSRGIGRQALSL